MFIWLLYCAQSQIVCVPFGLSPKRKGKPGRARQYEYDAYGLPVARRVQQGNGYIQDFSYKFDP
ncbi:hypothetical protein D0T57_15520, partial [Dysgonomonas sp. 511]|nr:hypothetical protein [Dysgonomonas sp. 511]